MKLGPHTQVVEIMGQDMVIYRPDNGVGTVKSKVGLVPAPAALMSMQQGACASAPTTQAALLKASSQKK